MTSVIVSEPKSTLPELPTVPAGTSMTQLLALAVERGTPVDALEKLVALHERMSQQQAQQDFAAAMAAFQRECPPIKKTSTANFATRQGGKMSYSFAELDEIARTVNPILARHGLSYTWDATVAGGSLTCVCTVRHAAGWSMTSTVVLPTDSASAMSSQQKVGSAYTFARRLSLTAALGLTTTDDDVDGQDVGGGGYITGDQVIALDDLITETGANRAAFYKYLRVDSLVELPADRYALAVQQLEKKRGAK